MYRDTHSTLASCKALLAICIFVIATGIAEADQRQLQQICNSCESVTPIEAEAGYAMWWTNGTQLPPLVTTSPNGTNLAAAGVLGGVGTSILYGADSVGTDMRSGGMARLVRWLDCGHNFALDLSYFGAGSPGSGDFESTGNQPSILTRPIFNATTQAQDAQLVRFPNEFAGRLAVDYASEFHSGAALARIKLSENCGVRHDLTAGYRYFGFREGISFAEDVVFINPVGPVALGTSLQLRESLGIRSNFHGAELGWVTKRNFGWFCLQTNAKVALGGVEKRLTVKAATRVGTAGNQFINGFGLLAQPSNIGVAVEHDFALLPQLGAKCTVPLTDCLGLMVGYEVFCLTNAGRIGNSIDTTVDLSPVQQVARPAAVIGDSALVGQGLVLGATLAF